MALSVPIPKPNYSDERREMCLWYFANHPRGGLSQDAEILLVIGMLVCDDNGFMPQKALESAMADPSAVQAARTLLKEWK